MQFLVNETCTECKCNEGSVMEFVSAENCETVCVCMPCLLKAHSELHNGEVKHLKEKYAMFTAAVEELAKKESPNDG